jgi:hypothetical protein
MYNLPGQRGEIFFLKKRAAKLLKVWRHAADKPEAANT